MLEHFFGSKTRAKLLTHFVHNPDKAFFVRELTRLIDTQINAVRRELENLVELGLLNEIDAPAAEQNEGKVKMKKHPGLKRKYYKMNEGFPLIVEVRTLITKAHVLMERRLDREIGTLGDIHYAALMGSFIGRVGSPVDLFIVGTVDQKTTRKFITNLEKEMGFEINFTCLTPQDYAYRKEITDRFLYGILESPKSVLVDKLK